VLWPEKKVKPFIEVDLDDPVLNAYMLFVQTADAVDKYADASFYQKARLSAAKYVVLQVLAANEGSMTPSQIAHWTLRERHNITTLVARMQKDRLVRTERNAGDKRFVNVTLTDEGRKSLARAAPVAREIVTQVMASVGERSITHLIKSMNILRRNAHEGLSGLDIPP
jgi:MarR family transcriptional repressor of emrRAB